MRRISKTGLSFGMVAALGLASSSAPAQNLQLSELAAALALPVITGGYLTNPLVATQGDLILMDDMAITLLTITNGRAAATTLKIDVISGDPGTAAVGGDGWGSDSMTCLLTGRETVTFLVVPSGLGSTIYGECTNLQANGLTNDGAGADNKMFAAKAQNGIMFVAAGDPVPPGVTDTSPAISQDILFGDAVVVDLLQGQAYGFSAIPFQAGAGANDGNKEYKFDGLEYSQWPSSLATNFIAPDNAGLLVSGIIPTRINAELILFTLDGSKSAFAPPTVGLSGFVWDDDEMGVDWTYGFDCFDIVSLADITANFTQPFLGSLSGHLTITPQPIGSTSTTDAHDATYGNSDSTRRRPVHGWIVQNVLAGQTLVEIGQPSVNQPNAQTLTGGPAAWGRPLSQNRFALAPDAGDMPPVLNRRC